MKLYITILCISIILFSLLSSYKIESFVNENEQSDNVKTPNTYICQNFIEDSIKKNKLNWDMSKFTDDELKMLAILKTGIDTRYTDKRDQFSKNNCVIPNPFLSMVGTDDKCILVENMFENNRPARIHELKKLQNVQPNGCIIDFSNDKYYKNQDNFKHLLNDMHTHFNKNYLYTIAFLKRILAFLQTQEIENENEEIVLPITDYNTYCDPLLFTKIENTFNQKVKEIELRTEYKSEIANNIRSRIPMEFQDEINFEEEDLPDIIKTMDINSTKQDIIKKYNIPCQSSMYDEMKKTYNYEYDNYHSRSISNQNYLNAKRTMDNNFEHIIDKINKLTTIRDKLVPHKPPTLNITLL